MKFRRILVLATLLWGAPRVKAEEIPDALADMERDIVAVDQQTRALDLVRSRFLEPQRSAPIDIRSNERLSTTLWEAEAHLLLGDPARSLGIVNAVMETGSGHAPVQQKRMLKIRFESERKLGKILQALESCRAFLSLGERDDLWFMSCAHLISLQAREKNETPALRTLLATFATDSHLRPENPHLLRTALLLAAGFEHLGEDREARTLLTKSLNLAKEDDPWRFRAKYARGLYDLRLGAEAEGLLALRELARAPLPTATEEPPADAGTLALARMALARYYEANANASESDRLFERALEALKTLPRKPRHPKKGLGVVANPGTPEPRPELAVNADLTGFRAEYAAHLCALGKADGCAHEFDAVSEDIPERPVAEVLTRSPAMRAQGIQRLARLAGYAQTDLAFVTKQKELPMPLSYEDLTARASALVSIAITYGSQGEHLSALSRIEPLPRELKASAQEMRAGLASVLAPCEAYLDSPTRLADSLALGSLERLSARLQDLARELDATSLENWSKAQDDGAAQGTRAALLSRLEALRDGTTRRTAAQDAAPSRAAFESVQSDVRLAARELDENRARAGNVALLLNLLKEEQKERWWRDAQRGRFDALGDLEQVTAKLEATLLENRLTLLQAEVPSGESLLQKSTLPRTQKTIEELSALHERRFGASSDAQQARFKGAWSHLVAAHGRVLDAAADFRRHADEERRFLTGEAQRALRELEELERREMTLAEKLRKEFQSLVPRVARELEPAVSHFRDEVRLALADSDGDVLRETESARRTLEEAAAERRRWMETLRESLRWGLAR